MSGWHVARACKEMRPDVPALLVTGWGVELSQDELAAHGDDAVLAKPLKVAEWRNVVASFPRMTCMSRAAFGAERSWVRNSFRAPARPAQSIGGRFGRGAEPPSEQEE